MPAVILALNVLLAIGIVAAIVGGLLAAVATQHRDHGVMSSGPVLRRRVWSQSGRPHAGPKRPWVVRRGQVWPVA